MTRSLFVGTLLLATAATGALSETVGKEGTAPRAERPSAWVNPGVPHPGSDQIFWVPTFAQAEAMAKATGRLMLVIGSVSDWNGY